MKKRNAKAKLYEQRLAAQMNKISEGAITLTEAKIAAKGITHTLIEAGDSLDLKTVNKMAQWVVEQKLNVDNGTLIRLENGDVLDMNSNQLYKK